MPFDHELKLGRALKHLQDLDAQAKAWVTGNHYAVRYEYDPDARWDGPIPPGNPDPGSATYYLAGSVFFPGLGPGTPPPGVGFGEGRFTAYATAERPPLDPLSLLIGDTLHNLRSALDVLAYALAFAHSGPLTQDLADSSEFPVVGDENRKGESGVGSALFRQTRKTGEPAPGSGLFKIRGWHPDAQTIVEGLQPYHRGKDYRSDPLWILHVLDRVSKHRLLHTTSTITTGNQWRMPGGADSRGPKNVRCIGPGFIRVLGGAIETDTPISDIRGIHPIDPDRDVDMDIDPALDVAVDSEIPAAAGQPIVGCLAEIYSYIIGSVLPPLTPFLE